MYIYGVPASIDRALHWIDLAISFVRADDWKRVQIALDATIFYLSDEEKET